MRDLFSNVFIRENSFIQDVVVDLHEDLITVC